MRTKDAQFQYIKGGSIHLPLSPICKLPDRHDVTMYGQFFRGDDVHLIRHLPGRVHGNICYRAYDVTLTVQTNTAWTADSRFNASGTGGTGIYVTYRTGLGTQYFEVRSYALRAQIHALTALGDDALHAFLVSMVKAQVEGAGYGYQAAEHAYQEAFLDGRLKRRKVRGTNRYRVEVQEPAKAVRIAMSVAA